MPSAPGQSRRAEQGHHAQAGEADAAEQLRSAVERTREALAVQTRHPDSVIELSAPGYRGLQDLSRSLRSQLLEDRRQAHQTATTGPGGTKNTQLWRSVERQLPDGFNPRQQWLWILPAGTIPTSDALERLEERLFTVKDEEHHTEIQVIGAKQLSAETPERLVNVGLFNARSGEVLTQTEPKELDQGQYDGRDAVPAVSGEGMLVHASLFGDLGGFDPGLSGDYASAQFCRRAREVGAHIVIEPTARVLREDPPRRDIVHRLGGTLYLPGEQRIGQIRRRLVNASPLAVPFLWLGMWAAALLRLIGLIVVKVPDAGIGQFFAAVRALLSVGATAHTRRFDAQGRKAALARLSRDEQIESPAKHLRAGRAAESQLTLSSAAIRHQRQTTMTAETVSAPRTRFTPGFYGEPEDTGERENNEDALLEVGASDGAFDEMPSRRSGDRLGLFLMMLALIGASLLAFRGLLSAEAITGGAALPVAGSLQEVFANTVSFLSLDSLGVRSAADPFNLILLVVSALSLGHGSAVLVWLLILALPLSAMTAWYAAGLWSTKASRRVVSALLWAAMPTLHIAVGEGRIGAVLVHILLPVAVVATVRAVGRAAVGLGVAGSWEYATGAALLLMVLTAASPALLPLVVILGVVLALVLGRRGRPLWLIPLTSLAVAVPMLASVLTQGKNLAAVLAHEPGRALAADAAPVWQQLLGFSRAFDPAGGLAAAAASGSWLPGYLEGDFWNLRIALLIGLPLLLIALLGMFTGSRSRPLPIVAGVLLLGALGLSVLVSLLAAGSDGTAVIGGNPGPVVSVMLFCLLAAGMASLDRFPLAFPRVGGTITPVISTLLVLSIGASLVLFYSPRMAPGATLTGQPLTAVNAAPTLIEPGSVRQLPATAADQGTGPAQLRTLVLSSADPGVIGELVSGEGRTLDKSRSVIAAGDSPLWAQPERIPDLLGGTAGTAGETGTDAAEFSTADQRLSALIAALVTPGAVQTAELMSELGIGYVLIDANEPDVLTDAVDTAAGLISVGTTDRGELWRAEVDDEDLLPATPGISGVPTAWARIVDPQGEVQALLPAMEHQLSVDLQAVSDDDGGLGLDPDGEYLLELATEDANGWQASWEGEALDAVPVLEDAAAEDTDGPGAWTQRFELPAEAIADQGENLQGDLSAEHRSPYQLPILIILGAFLLLVVLIAIPLPRGSRILPVANTDELEGRRG
ncbi:glycosyltransferase family 2 protein [Nesterenkonia halotolerans]|uniref:glycosyltransferase family 2 protein n=1 Tax=Nesterenkonia halotolerans TaxID=225325 RepID=UPI003EE56038